VDNDWLHLIGFIQRVLWKIAISNNNVEITSQQIPFVTRQLDYYSYLYITRNIYLATGVISLTGNTIQNCTVYGTGASVLNGILNSAGSGTLDFTNNQCDFMF
jgi:hypothetical protein